MKYLTVWVTKPLWNVLQMWHQERTDVEATTFHINLVIQLWVKNEEGEDKLYWDDADLDNPTSDRKHF